MGDINALKYEYGVRGDELLDECMVWRDGTMIGSHSCSRCPHCIDLMEYPFILCERITEATKTCIKQNED